MANNYGYYLPLADTTFESVRFLGITPKYDGVGHDAPQRTDKDGTPLWVVSALVKVIGGRPETELFTLTASHKVANEVASIPELSAVRLVGLAGGKWSRQGSDRTEWSFQVQGVQAL